MGVDQERVYSLWVRAKPVDDNCVDQERVYSLKVRARPVDNNCVNQDHMCLLWAFYLKY